MPYIYLGPKLIFMVHVGMTTYTIHGCYGLKASIISTAEQVRIAQQRLAEQVDVAERRAYEVRGPGWVMQQYTYWVEIIGYIGDYTIPSYTRIIINK